MATFKHHRGKLNAEASGLGLMRSAHPVFDRFGAMASLA